MNLTLLIPESCCPQLSHRHEIDLQPLTSVPAAGSQLLTIQELRNQLPRSGDVAVTLNHHPAQVEQMLSQLLDLRAGAKAVIVSPVRMIPDSLRSVIPGSMHSLLQLPQPSDLYYLSRQLIDTAESDVTLRGLVLNQKSICISGQQTPQMVRFPSPGPGTCPADARQIRTAIAQQVAELGLPSYHSQCLTSGVLLLWDLLDDSHEISQTMEGKGSPRTADFWHAIMHRREPDPGNAVYWFRRVGPHPAFEKLGQNLEPWMRELGVSEELIRIAVSRLLRQHVFDPFAMVELSKAAVRRVTCPESDVCRIVQYLEILNLLCWSLQSGRAGEKSVVESASDCD